MAASAKKGARPGRSRIRELLAFDRRLGHTLVAGADEAGRGALAGPLVAAAVLIDYSRIGRREAFALRDLADSKECPEALRDRLLPLVVAAAVKTSVIVRSSATIDDNGLHVTNIDALRDALRKVAAPGCMCLSDGFPLASVGHPQMAVVRGDARSAAIAAASIVAKVTRDRLMRWSDVHYPGFGFARHVGYSTPEHRSAVEARGPCPLHRKSFAPIAVAAARDRSPGEELPSPVQSGASSRS